MLKRFLFLAIIIGLFALTAQAQTPLLQALIDATPECGTLTLPADVVYVGNHVIRKCITIESNGTRVVRNASGEFLVGAKVISPNAAPALYIEPGVSGVKLRGFEVTHVGFIFDIVRIGTTGAAQDTFEEAPQHVSLDEMWIHGQPDQDSKRGVAANGAFITITNSNISETHIRGDESQAIGSWNGPGPFFIFNNYLESAGENILFGGSDPSIFGMVPTGIEIRGNYLFKPLSWKVGHSTYAGFHWGVKNLLEIKMGRNVVIDGNILENCWGDAQIGYAVLFTVRNQNGHAPWAILENLAFTNNVIKNSEQGMQLLGMDSPNISQQSSGLLIRNNLFLGIRNWFITIQNYHFVTIDHNTHFQGHNILNLVDKPAPGFVFRNNLTVRTGGFGVFGGGIGEGSAALQFYTPQYVFAGNVIAGALASIYPPDNFFPQTIDEVALLSDYRLSLVSPFKNRGTDGTDPGADIDKINAALSGIGIGGPSTPTPTPTPTPAVTPTPTPSPNVPSPGGTKDVRITDNSGGVWTLGSRRETLRNSAWMSDGLGTIYKWLNSTVYVQGTDAAQNWYQWSGSRWEFVGVEPGSTPVPSPTPVPTPLPSPSPSPSPNGTPRCVRRNPKGKCLRWM